jgi:molybdopterin-guanine dinucleotide biosynthesis protein MobB
MTRMTAREDRKGMGTGAGAGARAGARRPRPVLAVCGWSGAGKTTLIEAVLPELAARGLTVAVWKHDAHGPEVDHPGKDSDRLFRAGAATVRVDGPRERFTRAQTRDENALAVVRDLLAGHDLVLVEGNKTSPFPKVWLEGADAAGGLAKGAGPDAARPAGLPDGLEEVLAVLPRRPSPAERCRSFLALVERELAEAWRARPRAGGILIGGRSRRMGSPKHLLEFAGQTLLAATAAALAPHVGTLVVLGAGGLPGEEPAGQGGAGEEGAGGAAALATLPRLPDPPGYRGPIAGLLAALRWDRQAAWVVAACDHPGLTSEAVAWLLGERAPGRLAVFPVDAEGRAQPFPAVYEPRSLAELERLTAGGRLSPSALAGLPGVHHPPIPAEFRPAWRGANTPMEFRRALGREVDPSD